MPFDPPHSVLLVIWVLWLAQAGWACMNQRRYRARADRFNRRKARDDQRHGPFTPPVAIIVPVKGGSRSLDQHLRAVATQRYPAYRVIYVVESESDAAFEPLRRHAGSAAVETRVVVAGKAESGGQKVHNQLRGLRELREEDEVVVFADADAVPNETWLESLVHPLWNQKVGASTGYRWLIPEEPVAPASVYASILNSSVATLMGPPRRNHAWGGSMAIRRKTLRDRNLEEHWRGALSDDYQLTRVVDRAGLRIEFSPWCVLASPVRHTWGSLWEFARRQYTITRVHAPLLWLAALSIFGVYTVGWVTVAFATVLKEPGWGWGLSVWGVVFLLDIWRASLRRDAVRHILGEDIAVRLTAVWRTEQWFTPVWMGLHLAIVLSTSFGRRITWAGTRYLLRSPTDVRILSNGE